MIFDEQLLMFALFALSSLHGCYWAVNTTYIYLWFALNVTYQTHNEFSV